MPAPLAAYLEHARALPDEDPADLLGVRASTSRVLAAAAAETLLRQAAALRRGAQNDATEQRHDAQQVKLSDNSQAKVQQVNVPSIQRHKSSADRASVSCSREFGAVTYFQSSERASFVWRQWNRFLRLMDANSCQSKRVR
jgi:hypothetical protein